MYQYPGSGYQPQYYDPRGYQQVEPRPYDPTQLQQQPPAYSPLQYAEGPYQGYAMPSAHDREVTELTKQQSAPVSYAKGFASQTPSPYTGFYSEMYPSAASIGAPEPSGVDPTNPYALPQATSFPEKKEESYPSSAFSQPLGMPIYAPPKQEEPEDNVEYNRKTSHVC